MRKSLALVLCALVSLLLGSAIRVKADPPSPSVWAVPIPAQRYGYVDLHIKPSPGQPLPLVIGTPIRIRFPAGAPTQQWDLYGSGSTLVTITLHSYDAEVYIRFGAGGQADVVIVAGTVTKTPGPYSWSPLVPDPLTQGEYELVLYFKEGTLSYRFDETGFLMVPEVPLGVAATLMASLAGLGLRRLRRKY